MQLHFVSLGCDKNLVDSEVMLGILSEEGYAITADETQADVIIINTCGFILDATEEGIQNILRLAGQKKNGCCKALIVTGCMAQRYKDEIFKELPEVDAVVGPRDYEVIGSVIRDVLNGSKKIQLVSEAAHAINEQNSLKRVLTTPGHLAYLKIAEGCDNCCTYCTIPSIRGGYRSRTMDSLIAEADMLAHQGVKELILVAQDTALYGADIYGRSMLHELLRRLSLVDGVEWIRILYCYPEHITEETIQEMAENKKVCHYLDMPVQHSSDKILKLMGRGSTADLLQRLITQLRNAMPDISIRTTLMTGFPGEDAEDYENLCEFVKEMRFDNLGAFAYSREDDTPAFSMPEQIEEKVKQRRKNNIMKLQQRISHEKRQTLIGKTLTAIIDGFLPEEGVYCGRSHMDCYEIDGMIFIKCDYELNIGDFAEVMITGASDYDLEGEVSNEYGE